jgi:hypothetical protein
MPPLLARVATKPTMAIRIDRRRMIARARPRVPCTSVRAAHAARPAAPRGMSRSIAH